MEDDRIFMPMSDSQSLGAQQSRGFDFFKSGSNSGSLSLTSSTLYDLQSSALSIIWLCGAASPISAWAAVGFSIRRAVDVGAHREVRGRWSRSPLDDQLRKRACQFALCVLFLELTPFSQSLHCTDSIVRHSTSACWLPAHFSLLNRNFVVHSWSTDRHPRRRHRSGVSVSAVTVCHRCVC